MWVGEKWGTNRDLRIQLTLLTWEADEAFRQLVTSIYDSIVLERLLVGTDLWFENPNDSYWVKPQTNIESQLICMFCIRGYHYDWISGLQHYFDNCYHMCFKFSFIFSKKNGSNHPWLVPDWSHWLWDGFGQLCLKFPIQNYSVGMPHCCFW